MLSSAFSALAAAWPQVTGGGSIFAANATAPGCTALEALLPEKVFFPGSEVYGYESTNFWSKTEILSPGCVFRPESAADVSTAVARLRPNETGYEFAVRSGGHMGVPGANNINDGVLFVMSNLSTIALSEDKSRLALGPTWKWGDVYTWLEKHRLAVVGGRIYPVGVAGLLLAGGVSYHGNQHGWAADNVVEYEVVLASGKIVNATASENADLFWALKGGGNNFGIVTKFTLRTFASPGIWGGIYAAAQNETSRMLGAIAHYAAFNTDPKSHLVAMNIATGRNSSVPAAIIFHDSASLLHLHAGQKKKLPYPACFAPFFAIPAASNSCGFKSVAALAAETAAAVTNDHANMFIAGTVAGRDHAALERGVRLTSEVWAAHIPYLYDRVPAAKIVSASLNWQPIGPLWAAGSRAANPAGNALGVDLDDKDTTRIAWAETVEWDGAEYDERVRQWAANATDAINAAARAAGLHDAFVYVGDASGFQLDEVVPGYGDANRARLLEVSRKYDPDRLFQKLLPGGFKVGL